jgi:hypothetical protein
MAYSRVSWAPTADSSLFGKGDAVFRGDPDQADTCADHPADMNASKISPVEQAEHPSLDRPSRGTSPAPTAAPTRRCRTCSGTGAIRARHVDLPCHTSALLWVHGDDRTSVRQRHCTPWAVGRRTRRTCETSCGLRAACVRGAHPLAGGVRRTQAVSPRRLFLAVHLLHARPASVGRIGLQPYRNRTGGEALPDGARRSRTWRPHADRRSPARTAFDACQSRPGAGGRTAQEQAGDSGADCVIEPSSASCADHPASAGATLER